MIIDTQQSDVEVIGDIQEFKTSIDPKNLEYITTLLSSNLYSNPEQSFIREIVSNAWDSHVEAGTTNTPVIIKFSKVDSCWSISIRDFGTGISPERFKEVYCNIGSSTKRESNDFIGGFGIGKYSSLACSNIVYIISYYNGIKYSYIMTKSGNSITTNLVQKEPTKEKNGVEVTIRNITEVSYYKYKRALDCVIFFPNIYIDGISTAINQIQIKKFNNFAVASAHIDSKILLDKVLYPCNPSLLENDCSNFLYDIRYSGIVIKFDVGELNITPNRESIIYTQDTVTKIEHRIREAKKEIETIVNNKVSKDYTNLYELYSIIHYDIYYDFIKEEISTSRDRYTFPNNYCAKIDYELVTFKGNKVNETVADILNQFFGTKLINFSGTIKEHKFYQYSKASINSYRTIMSYQKLICVKGTTKLSSVFKSWLCKNYNDYTVIKEFSKSDFINYVIVNVGVLRHELTTSPIYKDAFIDYMYEYLNSQLIFIDVHNDSDYNEYKSQVASNKANYKALDNYIIYKQEGYEYKSKHEFKTLQDCIAYIKRLKKGVLLLEVTDTDNYYEIAKFMKLEVIKARKAIVAAIRELHPSFLVDLDYSLTKDSRAVKLHTIRECFRDFEVPTMYTCKSMLSTIPKALQKEFKDLLLAYNKGLSSYDYYRAVDRCTDIDEYTKHICEKFKRYWKAYTDTCEAYCLCPDRSDMEYIITATVLLKNKVYRINLETYNRIKDTKFLNVLCRK